MEDWKALYASKLTTADEAVRQIPNGSRVFFGHAANEPPVLVDALVRVTQQFADACFAAKCEEKLLDYADFEHLTLDLLLTPDNQRTPLCRTVSSHYSAVLVDEYQDTNALQDAIYFALARPEGDNLFFVGDIKQSIYRFRQADPQVFVDKQQRWQAYPQPAPQPASLALDANFRSAPGVIAGINYLFEVFFSQGLGGVAYGDGQRLVVGSKTTDYRGFCEVDVIDGAGAEGDAAAIAARIREMMAEGFVVRDKTGQRPCRYDDFCILLRGRGDFAVYEAALRTAGIPVFADTAADLLDEPHIRPLAALLRVIDNPAQDIYLAAAMLGPMFGFTDDDLVRLRAGAQTPDKRTRISLYGAVLQAVQSGAEDDFTLRVQAFYRRLTALRRMARSVPVEELLEEIFVSTGYLAALGAMENGQRRREDAQREPAQEGHSRHETQHGDEGAAADRAGLCADLCRKPAGGLPYHKGRTVFCRPCASAHRRQGGGSGQGRGRVRHRGRGVAAAAVRRDRSCPAVAFGAGR